MQPKGNAMKRWTAVFLVWVSVIAFSQDSISVALQRLATIDVFAFGPVGFGATTSEGEIYFKAIMSLPPAKAINLLEKLYVEGNPQSKSYALAGLRKLKRGRFEQLRISLRDSDVRVEMLSGCIGSEQSLSEVANDLESGKYDAWIR